MKKKNISELIREQLLIFDGAMGTELYKRHVFTNRSYDEICLSDPKLVMEVHMDYLRAGADVLTSNSYGANRSVLQKFGLADQVEAINSKAVELMRSSIERLSPERPIYLAGSIGPLEPGLQQKMSREEAVQVLVEQAEVLAESGVDFLIFETMPDREAAMQASLAMAKLTQIVPFVLSHALPDGEDLPGILAHRLQPMQNDLPIPFALGLNCGLGPARMLEALEAARKLTELPIIVQPNAGTPRKVENRQLYLCSPEYLSTYAQRYVNLGARGVGGCCGTSPEHISELARSLKRLSQSFSSITVSASAKQEVVTAKETALAERSQLGRKLANGEWIKTVEITPPRGWNTERIVNNAKLCRQHGVDAINIPDGPRAAPRLSALVTALKIQQEAGIEAVLHVCSRDRNYLALQADLLGGAAFGLRNFLFITGDPPKLGGYGYASGVFDTDSIGLVALQKHLNQGVDLGGQQIQPPTAAVIGVGADPNAIDFNREIERLKAKIDAGAEFIITQPVFDIEPFHKFMQVIEDWKVPVIAGVWPLASLRNALFMKNEVPGVLVPDSVVARIEKAQTREEQLACGIQIAREAIEQLRGMVAGVQVSAPLGNVNAALAVME
ncbi:MAG: bifunctional homocysteine S-methyltransferase/methylenetetrahydrofolate reductase [Oligosphaeraceae bacterium]|nr:bifunctional homocysteine S-methyltransferase/methylenetetrahydrofolate reductase [Oligosphaeraceae bacterium]